LRVLHVWNTAGVASVIAKYQARILKWETWVVSRLGHDPFSLTYYGEALKTSSLGFFSKVIWISRGYDLVHVHSLDKMVPLIKTLYPAKPVILHYHGSEIRDKWEKRKKYWLKADVIMVSTRDLLEGAPQHVIYLPNPVDTEFFRPMPHLRRTNTALYIYDPLNPILSRDLKWAREAANRYNLCLIIHNRRKNPVKHKDMPIFINKFEYLIDRKSVNSLSKTALEALACGLKVIRWDGKIVTGLPEDHRPEYVIKRLYKIYNSVT